MATPRSKLIDSQQAMHYHLISRCVRGAWLTGKDPLTGIDYSHRKNWIEERMRHLAQYFALELDAWAIMSTHLHIVSFYDPLAGADWSDDEVARRWVGAFPPRRKGEVDEVRKGVMRDTISRDPQLAEKRRSILCSVSGFMQHLKQPIAVRANQEDGCKGHFWEQRFYSGAILDEDHLLAAMAYVDLNPVRAGIAKNIRECEHTSIHRRLQGFENTQARLDDVVRPLVSGLGRRRTKRFSMTLKSYVTRLEMTIARHYRGLQHTQPQADDEQWSTWSSRLNSLGKRRRAFGDDATLNTWLEQRNFRKLKA